MENNIRETMQKAVLTIANQCKQDPLFSITEGKKLPSKQAIIEIIHEIRRVLFPGYFGNENLTMSLPDYFIGNCLTCIYENLKVEIETALSYKNEDNEEAISSKAEKICDAFFERLPYIQSMLLKDVQAGYDGDPAAKSKEEIIISYPGLFAIFVFRIAHEFYVQGVPFISRIMTEYAHGETGIDIHSGATIGEYFFIDHGTGIVVGETASIGNNVKIYQGVTLGALSTRKGQQLAGVKRHPTIENGVTIYSGSTILGGETVIGEEAVIGGNAFITKSIPPRTKVSVKSPELTLKEAKKMTTESPVPVWD